MSLARVYNCSKHVPSIINPNHCRSCWTTLNVKKKVCASNLKSD